VRDFASAASGTSSPLLSAAMVAIAKESFLFMIFLRLAFSNVA
jgi:hypothetical protein